MFVTAARIASLLQRTVSVGVSSLQVSRDTPLSRLGPVSSRGITASLDHRATVECQTQSTDADRTGLGAGGGGLVKEWPHPLRNLWMLDRGKQAGAGRGGCWASGHLEMLLPPFELSEHILSLSSNAYCRSNEGR